MVVSIFSAVPMIPSGASELIEHQISPLPHRREKDENKMNTATARVNIFHPVKDNNVSRYSTPDHSWF